MKISLSAQAARTAGAAIARAAKAPQRPSETSAKWRAVWTRKGAEQSLRQITMTDLFKLDGWDTGAGQMDAAKWRRLVAYARQRLGVRKGDALLEVGCGAGLFLLPFARRGVRVSGVDYSRTLVEIARVALPAGATVRHAEASRLPFARNSFDHAASNGVFLYFPNWRYAEKALDEILRVLKPGCSCLITDLNDRTKRRLAESRRRQNLGAKKYRQMYKGLGHMYYRKEWFLRYARQRRLIGDVVDQSKANNYGNSAWRFMFYFEKPLAA